MLFKDTRVFEGDKIITNTFIDEEGACSTRLCKRRLAGTRQTTIPLLFRVGMVRSKGTVIIVPAIVCVILVKTTYSRGT